VSDIVARWQAANGTWLEMRPMRPLRPSEQSVLMAWFNNLSPHTRRNRFFAPVTEFSDAAVHHLVDVDAQHEYLLAVVRYENDHAVPIGGGRFVHEENEGDGASCSFSLLIGDEWQGQGIGRRILKALLREASRRGLRKMRGDVLADNRPMLKLARSLRFEVIDRQDGVVHIVRNVPRAASARWRRLVQRLLRK
jgi:acetyltransferase